MKNASEFASLSTAVFVLFRSCLAPTANAHDGESEEWEAAFAVVCFLFSSNGRASANAQMANADGRRGCSGAGEGFGDRWDAH